MSKKSKSGGLVYSSELGRICPSCEHAIDDCRCKETRTPEGDGIVSISLETKGRKGKGVTLLKGLLLTNDELKKLAKELKQKCGVGGAVKNGVIEIQGDHRQLLVNLLEQKHYTVKRVGG